MMKPYPPWFCQHLAATRTGDSPAYSLAMDDSIGVRPAGPSVGGAHGQQAGRVDLGRHVGQAPLDRLELADRLPNWLRSCEYSSAASNAPCAMPTDRAAIEMRPPSSTRKASVKAAPSFPNRFSGGMRQSSKIISDVSLARKPSLPQICGHAWDRYPGELSHS